MISPTLIFRIFYEEKARGFYLSFLEFKVDWEHRFEEELPLYKQISFGACILHLSENYGGCCPGAAVRIEVSDIEALHARLTVKEYKYARPGIEETPWNTREVRVGDPFGNRIVFYENM